MPGEVEGVKTWVLYRCPKHGVLPRACTHLAFDAEVGSDDLACSYCKLDEDGETRVEPIEVGEVSSIRSQERQRVREAGEKWASERRQWAHDLIHNAAPGSDNLFAANVESLLGQGVEKFLAALDSLEDDDA